LGRRQSGAIEKAIGVLAFDICENLGFPGIEVAFGKLNTKVMIHIWDGEYNGWLGWWCERLPRQRTQSLNGPWITTLVGDMALIP
jgi:hypothetical protein